MRFAPAAMLLTAFVLLASDASASGDSIRIGVYSQKASPSKARIGGSVRVTHQRTSRSGNSARPVAPSRPTSGSPTVARRIRPGSRLLRDRTPAGRGSFWYTTLDGQRCIYVADSPGPCYTVAPAGRPAAEPPVDPTAVAVTAAKRLDLHVGEIRVSPSPRAQGLTGAPSWFWLEPAPTVRSVSVSVRRERVNVTATAKGVRWAFGDGSSLEAGPGVAYRPSDDDPPEAAVRHGYETRCLPGDQGHDPYVLATCGPRGYTVTAQLGWDISYEATGPISDSGTLPSQATEGSLEYPVSESRGFLTAGDAG